MSRKKKGYKLLEPKRTYSVGVCVTISSHITVKASSAEEAVELAKAKYPGHNELECPCVDVDFDQPEDVEVEEEDEDDL